MAAEQDPGQVAVPLGTVLIFAGDAASATVFDRRLAPYGWSLANGTLLDVLANRPLYDAIGSCHGGRTDPGRGGALVQFALPDLNGMFVRGVNGASLNDPDAKTRTIRAVGMTVPDGNFVGTVQGAATGLPRTPFTTAPDGRHQHTMWHVQNLDHSVTGLTGDNCVQGAYQQLEPGGDHTHQIGGGDPETRPQCLALYHVISSGGAEVPAVQAAQVPVGAVVMFAGDLSNPAVAAGLKQDGWLACHGHECDSADYPELAGVLGTSFGGAAPSFRLPDLRGRFVRGTDRTAKRDPDAGARAASRPDLDPGGASGPAVGSSQDWSTRMPVSPFTVAQGGEHGHTAPVRPLNAQGITLGLASYSVMAWSDGTAPTTPDGTHSHQVAGGDAETRPANVYLHWLVRAVAGAASVPLPVGTIMAFAGDGTKPGLLADGWRLCDGSLVDGATYPDLHAVIGLSFTDPDNPPPAGSFALPDLCGRFVRGADPAHPANATWPQAYPSLTGPPATSAFQAAGGVSHSHFIGNLPYGEHLAEIGAIPDAALAGPRYQTLPAGAHAHGISGGDAESRPVNIYLDFVIKVTQDR